MQPLKTSPCRADRRREIRPAAAHIVFGRGLGAGLAAAAFALTLAGPASAASPANACTIPLQKSDAEQLQSDLFEQSLAWDQAALVYLGVVTEQPPASVDPGTPPLLHPAGARTTVRVAAERLLKGRLPDAAVTFDFPVEVTCVPSDLLRSRPGDRLVIYAEASGPDGRSGAIMLDRIRDPATLSALGAVSHGLAADLNNDGTIDLALLSWPNGAALGTLDILVREPGGELRRQLSVPGYVWGAQGGGSAGARPSLSLSDGGALLVREQADGSGLDRFVQVRTIEWQSDHFILARFEREQWTTANGMTDHCVLDLKQGVAVWNDRRSRFLTLSPAVEHTTEWNSCEAFLREINEGPDAPVALEGPTNR